MPLRVRWLLTIIFAGLLVAPVLGQPLRGGVLQLFQQGADASILIRAPSVQKEIKLTNDQAEKFRKIARQVQGKHSGDLAKTIQELREKINKAIPDVLSEEQAKRLEQIKLQANGILSFTKPEVQQKLKLTEKQKEEIEGIAEGTKRAIRRSVEDSKNFRERLEALQQAPTRMKEATAKAVAKLSEDQKKKWHEMIGDKFELDLSRLGGLP